MVGGTPACAEKRRRVCVLSGLGDNLRNSFRLLIPTDKHVVYKRFCTNCSNEEGISANCSVLLMKDRRNSASAENP